MTWWSPGVRKTRARPREIGGILRSSAAARRAVGQRPHPQLSVLDAVLRMKAKQTPVPNGAPLNPEPRDRLCSEAPMKEQNGLNANQLKAVNWDQGPLLVLAGPGSGATAVLARRVARLICESPEARFRVLGLTFTTRAAGEIRKQVESILGSSARARVTTFHSFCATVLRQHGNHVGLRSDFELLARDEERARILDESVRNTQSPDRPAVGVAGVLRLIDFLFREGYDGAETTALPFNGSAKSWMRPVYNNYLDTLIAGNHLDYGALLVCCLRLFRERPRIARHYQIVYPHVCVDEYQDTNKCQDLILRCLSPVDRASLFVVADDDQIYQWNGASPARLDGLRHDYEMPVVQLPESDRCPAAVIQLANNLIRFNVERLPGRAPLTAAAPASCTGPVRVHRFSDEPSEAAWVADDIRERALPSREVAVLARSTKLLELAVRALQDAGLVAYLRKPRSEMESAPVRFVLAALRLAIGPREVGQLRILCKAFFDLTGIDLRVELIEAEGDANGGSLLLGFLEVATTELAVADTSLVLDALRDKLLDRLQYIEFADAVFDWYRDDRRNRSTGGAEDEAVEEIAIWKEITRKVSRHLGGAPPLSRFMQELDLRPKVAPPARNAVQCLTIHSAKGQEFRHVYLMGLVEDQLPSYHATKAGTHPRLLEEERRNCFVAITRTQATLTLTYSDSYFGWRKEPSRFLREMGCEEHQRGR